MYISHDNLINDKLLQCPLLHQDLVARSRFSRALLAHICTNRHVLDHDISPFPLLCSMSRLFVRNHLRAVELCPVAQIGILHASCEWGPTGRASKDRLRHADRNVLRTRSHVKCGSPALFGHGQGTRACIEQEADVRGSP